MQHRLPVIAVVFNNGEYGNVRQMQRNLYGNRVIATDLVNPDFVALAQSFGALGLQAASPAELAISLRTAVAARRPTLIEVPVGDLPDVDRFRKMPRVRGLG